MGSAWRQFLEPVVGGQSFCGLVGPFNSQSLELGLSVFWECGPEELRGFLLNLGALQGLDLCETRR